jgi:hypothetical protein
VLSNMLNNKTYRGKEQSPRIIVHWLCNFKTPVHRAE